MIFLSKIKFGIIGGDYRYKYLYDLLNEEGFETSAYGNKNIRESEKDITQVLKNTDILIAPIPITKDKININLNNETIEIYEFISLMKRNSVNNIVCGVVSESLERSFNSAGINIFDFFNYEEVAVKNAIPTAEGAVMTAIQESDRTIFNSKAIVIGYGRCGKILAHLLKGMGADVTVTYRKNSDMAYIDAYGMKSLNVNELISNINQFDFVFNTAPFMVLNKEVLKRVSSSAVLVDISQAPGGVDYSYAKKLNIKALYCPGLPGRTAPYTAAEILKEIVIEIAMES